MTALYAALSVFPIIDVPNPLVFTVKMTVAIVLFNVIGAGIFFTYQRRRSA